MTLPASYVRGNGLFVSADELYRRRGMVAVRYHGRVRATKIADALGDPIDPPEPAVVTGSEVVTAIASLGDFPLA